MEMESFVFYISVKMRVFSYYGLAALDERRRLGLSDGTQLITTEEESGPVLVDEEFARTFFNYEDVTVARLIRFPSLKAGDVALVGVGKVVLRATPERIKAMWVDSFWEDCSETQRERAKLRIAASLGLEQTGGRQIELSDATEPIRTDGLPLASQVFAEAHTPPQPMRPQQREEEDVPF